MKQWLVVGAALLAAAPAFSQILIGQTAGFSGPVAAGVKETTEGAKLWIDAVNAKGGVNGQKIELISMDDKFDLGGLELHYSPEDHTGLDFADLSIVGQDGKFKR